MLYTDYGSLFSNEDINKLLNKVYSLKEYWLDYMPELQKNLNADDKFLILGESIYVIDPKQKISNDIRNMMLDNFKDEFKTLMDFLGDKTKIPFEFNPNLPVPGFHISLLKHQPKDRNYHVDNRILDRVHNVTSNAVICALSYADNPASLEYFDYKTNTHNNLEYTLGNVYTWGPDMLHRIAAKSLVATKGSPRITLQSHYYFDKDSNKNILFF